MPTGARLKGDTLKLEVYLYLEEEPNPCELLKGEFTLKFKIDAATLH